MRSVDCDFDQSFVSAHTHPSFSSSSHKTFLFVKNGEVQGRLVGANPDKLREAVHRYL